MKELVSTFCVIIIFRPNATSTNAFDPDLLFVMTGDTEKPENPDNTQEPERRKTRQRAEDTLNRLENRA